VGHPARGSSAQRQADLHTAQMMDDAFDALWQSAPNPVPVLSCSTDLDAETGRTNLEYLCCDDIHCGGFFRPVEDFDLSGKHLLVTGRKDTSARSLPPPDT
jgi:hypothetical protein